MADDEFMPDAGDDERLRTTMSVAAPDAKAAGVLDAVVRRVARRRRRVREAVAAGLVVVVGGGVTIGLGLGSGPQGTLAGPAATSTTSTSTTNPAGATAAQAQGMGAELHDGVSALPAPCNADERTPSTATGTYCGPAPHAGNGSGPNGTCAGNETAPPCGPGVVPGRYYAYTMPGTCSGLIFFDGKQWVSELPSPTPVPDFYVWISLGANGTLGWISPNGAVGFQPYVGQVLKACG